MNIVHITDFHLKSSKQDVFQQGLIIDKIIEQIKSSKEKIDFVFFTGDLVNSGTKLDDFTNVKNILINRFLTEFNLGIDRFFICQGNHDVNRENVSSAIVSRLDAIKTNEELDRFVNSTDIDFINSLLPLDNYDKFISSTFNGNNQDVLEKGYTTHIRQVDGKNIGILCANSAWRAVGINDDGNLLIPVSYIKAGLNNLKGCDFKILLHHHPLSQFKLYNQYELEDIIHNNFNISFSGHMHKSNTSICYTDKDGILKLASAATLAEKDGSTIGFTILNFNLELFTVNGFCYKYDRQDEFFYSGSPIKLQIPISQEKQKQNKFRQRLRELYNIELENADDLFLNGKTNKENKGFKELWTNPVISSKSPEEVKKNASVAVLSVDDLVKSYNNYLIMGDDKCGKTSLLKKMQLDCLLHYNVHEKIPYYIDAKKIDKTDFSVSKLEREVATYFTTNKTSAKEIMQNSIVILLIDNLDLRHDNDVSWLESVVQSFNYAQIIICTDQNSSSKYQNMRIGDSSVINVYFHNLKRKQLRELADKFYGSSDSKTEILTRINHIFTMLAIPFNFWSVSLFMWVFKDTSRDINNDVDLVDLYIESILEREKLIKSKSGFSYDKYKQYLAHLSRFLLRNNLTNYAATYDEIHEFTRTYLEENPRNNIEAKTIWDYILEKGILKLVEDRKYSFRLNGVFEYFLAHYLKLDSVFREEIISDDSVYLSFKNELEMYAGSNRSDEDFVNKIFVKTERIFRKVNEELSVESIDEILNSLGTDDIALQLEKSQTELLHKSLSQDEVDIIDDSSSDINNLTISSNCEVTLKRFIPIDENDFVSLERALYILGRVFKNADDIKNTSLINEIFDYLINTTVNWGYKLFKSFNPNESDEELNKSKSMLLVKLMKQMLPIIVQSRLSDMIGANNMQGIIKKKLKNLENESKENQFTTFILLYTLIDIDLTNNYDYINVSIEKITIPILRYAIMMKILYYYNFRLIEFSSQKRELIEKKLKDYYSDSAGKFNKKIYSKQYVNNTFQNIDKYKGINKK